MNRKLVFALSLFVLLCSSLYVRFNSVEVESSNGYPVDPDFILTDIDGNSFSLNDYRGRAVLLDFFHTNCTPSVNQFSELIILHEDFGEKLVIISISPENETALRDFRDNYNISWTIAKDAAGVFEAYDVDAIPTLAIIDQQGYICYTHVGLTEESQLRPEIESLLPKTIYVDDGNVAGPWNGTKEHPYQNITSGLEHASDNDIVFVQNGTYYEHVVVNKTVSLIGGNREATIIDGSEIITPIVHITADNVTVRAFTIQNSGRIYGWEGGGIYITDSNRNNIVENTITNTQYGINLRNSTSNTIIGNTIIENDVGIQFLDDYSSNSTIYHNNIIDNGWQVNNFAASNNTWDNSYPSGGNYWSDYDGIDTNPDAIGDSWYEIDENNIDHYPLMGMFSSFNTSLGYHVNVISNSTIGNFQYFESNSTIRMYASNMTASQTYGFCRIRIPHALISEPYNVTVDGANPTYWNYTLYDDGDNRWIYFSYEHTTLEIIIVPEFPQFLILLLFMIVTLLTVIVYKTKHHM